MLSLFAAVDEITQPIFGRHADGVDWAFDQMGLVAGIGAATLGVILLRVFLRGSPGQ